MSVFINENSFLESELIAWFMMLYMRIYPPTGEVCQRWNARGTILSSQAKDACNLKTRPYTNLSKSPLS